MSAPVIVHDVPGRLRVRLPAEAAGAGVAEAMRQEPGVVDCTWSPRTRGLLVRYRADESDGATLAAAVARRAGTEVPRHGAGAGADRADGAPGATLETGLREAARTLDAGVQRATRGAVGLSGLVPLALVGWALAELVRGRGAPLAWSSALWYAHGLYRDYAAPPPQD